MLLHLSEEKQELELGVTDPTRGCYEGRDKDSLKDQTEISKCVSLSNRV